MVKVEPLPGCDQTRTSPPWFCATCLTMLRPRPDPPGVAGPGRVAAVEPLEDAILLVIRNPDALVGDRDLDDAVGVAHADADARVVGRVLDGVRDQVVQGHHEQRLVAVDVGARRRR